MKAGSRNASHRSTDHRSTEDLQHDLLDITERVNAIEGAARAEGREPTAAETGEIADLGARFDRIEAALRRQDVLERVNPRLTMPGDLELEASARPRITGGMPAGTTRGSNGFRSMGDFAVAARRTSLGKPTRGS